MSAGFRSRWLEWTPEFPAPPVLREPEPRTKRAPAGFSGAGGLSSDRAVSAPPAPLVCFSCWGSDFWTGRGVVTCRRCHPPVADAEVRP